MKYDNYIRLEILTPVHIGNGDTSDPLDYVITSQDNVDYFCQIDLDAWLQDYPEQEELAKVLDSGKLPAIRKYIADNLDAEIYATNTSKIISTEVGKKYLQNIANANSSNQLLIDPCLKNPLTGGLLIPGSSIKGAMRTAVIDWCDQNWQLNLKNSRNTREYTQTLERALGAIRDNSFKNLKIGDFEAIANDSAVVTAKEKSIKAEKTNGTPKNSCQTCLSTATEGKAQQLFGRFAIGQQAKTQDATLTCTMNNRSQSWTLQELMKLVSDFYQKRYIDERNKFYHQAHFHKSKDVVQLLDRELLNLTDNQMVLRVGHYSHIEAMTITNNKPGGTKGFGKTRTLADDIYPFGWVKLTQCSKEEHDNFWQHKNKLEHNLTAQNQQRRQGKIEQRRHQLQQQLEQQRQQQLAEQERQAKEQDEQINPWKKIVREIDKIDSWGALKQQILDRDCLLEFRKAEPFVKAVYDLALSIRNIAPKWDNERDDQLVNWFAPSFKPWQILQAQIDEVASITQAEQQTIAQIDALNDWGAFKNSNIEVNNLTLAELQVLHKKVEEWGGSKNAKNKDKKALWKQLYTLIKQK